MIKKCNFLLFYKYIYIYIATLNIQVISNDAWIVDPYAIQYMAHNKRNSINYNIMLSK